MDSMDRAVPRVLGKAVSLRALPAYADGRRTDPPIYAQLVAEWQATGRAVPDPLETLEQPSTPWTPFAASAAAAGTTWCLARADLRPAPAGPVSGPRDQGAADTVVAAAALR
ncbi:hypothetical protein [Streptomyces sp. TLI_55]|uniref:hypothetical protein n=1 Tax=Streptomyces sp. TLI_55 TaxID=1938861 RepID=UPI00117FB46E|nr:hypothetical protein [Streptomyces sp. TLI_55]